MTIIDTPADSRTQTVTSFPQRQKPERVVGYAQRPGHRPAPIRPAGAALRYRGSGVTMSRASHRPKPITPVTTVLLALLAAGITVWLGIVANLGGVGASDAPLPEQELAVVQVQSGESLQHVAQRVAPDAPVSTVVQQIRDLNQLDSSALAAGQTLIAPVG